jgi:hypothetical protein
MDFGLNTPVGNFKVNKFDEISKRIKKNKKTITCYSCENYVSYPIYIGIKTLKLCIKLGIAPERARAVFG